MKTFPAFSILITVVLLSGGTLHGADLRQAQEKLKAQEFYFGDPSGVMDEDTSTALRRYQIRNGLAVTGELDAATAKSLGVNASGPAPPASAPDPVVSADRQFLENRTSATNPAPSQPAALPAVSSAQRNEQLVQEFLAPSSYAAADSASRLEVVRWTQARLKEAGYYQSGIDGVPGDGTRRAVAAYQADHGLRPTGLLDDATLDNLEARIAIQPLRPGQFHNTGEGNPTAIRGQQVFRGVRVR